VTLLLVYIGVYAALVLTVGLVASRRPSTSPEDYFLAGRGLGPLVLFMALFGTNCTAFVLVGIPGQAYHDGIGIFGVNAPIVALGIPLTFWVIGGPARAMAQRLGALTPAELYAKRFGRPFVGWLFFAVFTLYTLPYMVLAVKGTAITVEVVSEGTIPQWASALGVIVLTGVYTALGGMRATAWTNVLQGAVFLTFMIASFFFMSRALGGLDAATEAVRAADPDLLRVGEGPLFSPPAWTSWSLVITLTVIAFPHMFVRLMAAKDQSAIRGACRMYPLALAALWVPAVLIGVWGAEAFPGLLGRESDQVFSLMATELLPAWLGPMSAVVVLAALMSTLDAQVLTLSSMLVRDVIGAEHSVTAGRVFGVLIFAVVFVLTLTWGSSVFSLASFSFSGYVTLAPALFLGVRWRRFTATGAAASILAANGVYWACLAGWVPLAGFLPVFWAFVAGCAAGYFGSVATIETDAKLTARAFGA
jgi:SSS family solute:Na+ symporter